MATPLKVTHAVNCAAEQPTLTLQLPTEAASTLTVGGYDVAAALMTLGAKVADYDALVAALTPIAGCHSITDEATCVASKDNRAAHLNAPCTWCCGAACTGGSNGKCQPFNYLLSGGGHVNGYIGTGTVQWSWLQHMPRPGTGIGNQVRNPIAGAVALWCVGAGLQCRVLDRWQVLRRKRADDPHAEHGVQHGAGRQPWCHMQPRGIFKLGNEARLQ